MPRFGWNEFSMAIAGFTTVMVWVLIIIAFIRKGRDQRAVSPQAPAPAWPPVPAPAPISGEQSVHLVARITQRFCPRCRAPLAADAPEGLCPACLMAYGLASGAAVEPANGTAMTTPPSGSQPPTAGEWADLAQYFPQLEILELLGRGGMGAVY